MVKQIASHSLGEPPRTTLPNLYQAPPSPLDNLLRDEAVLTGDRTNEVFFPGPVEWIDESFSQVWRKDI